MAEFEEKLNSILGNQKVMGQIMALARSLSGEEAGQESTGAGETPSTEQTAGQEENWDLAALMGQIDPRMIQIGMKVLREYQNEDNRNAALLSALRPFLREEKRARLDQAQQLARMTRLIRVALGAIGGGKEEGSV